MAKRSSFLSLPTFYQKSNRTHETLISLALLQYAWNPSNPQRSTQHTKQQNKQTNSLRMRTNIRNGSKRLPCEWGEENWGGIWRSREGHLGRRHGARAPSRDRHLWRRHRRFGGGNRKWKRRVGGRRGPWETPSQDRVEKLSSGDTGSLVIYGG